MTELVRYSRVMTLNLITLPQFNVTFITRCLSVSERLMIMACIHRRFRNFVLQPQCFPDISFHPIDDDTYDPTIISIGISNIAYISINMFSQHPFIKRVALRAGMWNFPASLWNGMDWPLNINVESLQLTLDSRVLESLHDIHLDRPPRQQIIAKKTTLSSKLRNLFFTRFDNCVHSLKIFFPTTLWGIGLESFNASVFESNWWLQQIQFEV
jgi:hypothetical protein